MLSEKIVDEFHRINKVFPSHLVAFCAFCDSAKKKFKLDLYNLMRLPEEELIIPYEEFVETFERLLKQVHKMHNKGKVSISPALTGDPEVIIKTGLKNVGMYHTKRPLGRNKQGDLTT